MTLNYAKLRYSVQCIIYYKLPRYSPECPYLLVATTCRIINNVDYL